MIKKINYLFLVFFIILFSNLVFSATISDFFKTQTKDNLNTENSPIYQCNQGEDFIAFISPLQCSPEIVRDDLLEENDVPIYCKINLYKINPFVDVSGIKSVSFLGNHSKEISSVSYYPAYSALTGVQSNLKNPGYIKILLKKEPNTSKIPDFVEGNLSAKISYTLKDEVGIHDYSINLKEISNDYEWDNVKNKYSFWNNKGYIRLANLENNKATLWVYDSKDRKISSLTLSKGENSKIIYSNDFGCTGLQVKLQDLENPETKAQISINSNIVDLKQNDKFLDNKCSIISIDKYSEVVKIRCNEDNGIKDYSLFNSYKVNLSIDGTEYIKDIGDFLFSADNKDIYLVGISSVLLDNSPQNIVWIGEIPKEISNSAQSLNSYQITGFSSLISQIISANNIKNENSFSLESLTKSFGAFLYESFFYKIGSGQQIHFLKQRKDYTISGKKIVFNGFDTPKDEELLGEIKNNYELAKENYESVIKDFSSESLITNKNENVYTGERALYQEIILSYNVNQKFTASQLCEKFFSNYPNSLYIPELKEKYCNELKLSSSTNSAFVSINQNLYKISLNYISEPSFEEYGASFFVNDGSNRASFSLNRNGIYDLNSYKIPLSIRLSSIDSDPKGNYVNIQISSSDENLKKQISQTTYKIYKNDQLKIGNYFIVVSNINLKKEAFVSLVPSISSSSSQANFSFKIGIEKRAIKLTPEQTKSLIKNVNEKISLLSDISNGLESVIEPLKGACYLSTATLLIKNFISGSTSQGMARLLVMKGVEGNSGWYTKCEKEMKENPSKFSSLNSCLSNHSSEIEEDVQKTSSVIDKLNKEIKDEQSQDSYQLSTKSSLGILTTTIDKGKLKDNFLLNKDKLNRIINNTREITDNTKENLNKLLENQEGLKKSMSFEQARDLNLYLMILSETGISDNLKEIANTKLESLINEVSLTSVSNEQILSLSSYLGIDYKKIGILSSDSKGNIPYLGLVLKDLSKLDSKFSLNEFSNSPVYLFEYLNKENNKDTLFYLLLLEKKGNLYTPKNNKIFKIDKTNNGFNVVDTESSPFPFNNIQFISSSFSNKYQNPELKYYDSSNSDKLPSVVPIDTANGWYAGIEPLVYGNKDAILDSGRINIFYLCNVGIDGKEEFSLRNSQSTDDLCQMIDLGISESYKYIMGLSETESVRLTTKAISAIQQAQKASNQAEGSSVKILDQVFKVGKSQVDTNSFRCEDFMPHQDCLTIFNLCDPVICPSSRCDFGGKYKVDNVVQSGILGSIMLCLPNAKEGILFPICLTGIKAGVDSLNSVLKSYSDCLNISLQNGQTVGVCDEINSFYICDFVWRQVSPILNLGIPTIVESLLNKGRGGGEYINVQASWELTKSAADYFVNSYGQNSKKAFLLRSSENIGGEVCKLYTSFTTQDLSGVVKSLLKSDSPAQFTGRFDEIPLTTVTEHPTSHYKVYYHIYAGTDSGANYKVYLRNKETYYQDTSTALVVDSGYVPNGNYYSQTKDIIGNSGYNELCISVNNQEVCGFKEASTSMTINLLSDEYVKSISTKNDIKTEAQCAGGINQGIVRICSSKSPGEGIDAYYNTENARWKQVGVCGNENMKCWLDTNSVKDAIVSKSVEESTVQSLEDSYKSLINTEGELTEDQLNEFFEELSQEKDINSKINRISNILDKVYNSKYKANLIILRGDLYNELLISLIRSNQNIGNINLKTKDSSISQTDLNSQNSNSPSLTPTEVDSSEDYRSPVFSLNALIVSGEEKVNNSLSFFKDKSSSSFSNAKEAVLEIYEDEKVSPYCYYTEPDKKNYKNINNEFQKSFSVYTSDAKTALFYVDKENCLLNPDDINVLSDQNKKLNLLQKGDIISYVKDGSSSNSVIFIEWINQKNYIAKVLDWNGGNILTGRKYQEIEVNLSDNSHPVYMIIKPIPKDDFSNLPPVDSLRDYFKNEIYAIKLSSEGEGPITSFDITYTEASSLSSARSELINKISSWIGKQAPSDVTNCWKAVQKIYSSAGFNYECIYSDPVGKTYEKVTKLVTGTTNKDILQVNPTRCCKNNKCDEEQKLNLLNPGDIISYVYNEKIGHNAIFIEWFDKEKGIAKLFDWNDVRDNTHYYRYYKLVTLKDDSHPVYMIWKPVKSWSSSST
jgi:hypothetical protein